MTGETISHYKILEKLGGGGMGEVYKAEDLKLKRFVAIKFLPHELTRDPDAKHRFVHEAQAASSLEHSNICTVFEIDETPQGQSFIVMSYCPGETVKKKIERGPMGIDEALHIAIQTAQGLSRAHGSHVIHRDIKPANIMITDAEEIKIVDFGLAKLAGQTQLTKDGAMVGTVAYMSPEQIRGDTVDERTDIWSLGIVLYEMLSGKLPFKGDYDQAILYSIINEEPISLNEIRSDVSDELADVIKKSMSKDPSQRYQTIEDLLNELNPHFSGVTVSPGKKIKFHRLPKGYIVLSSFLLISIAVIIVFLIPDKTIPFSERDWIVITDFENLTDEPIFDKSLNTAFSLSIDQSRYVNVFSRQRMVETLKRMEKKDLTSINEQTGQEIALREGISIYLVPGISRSGQQYAVMCKIQDVSSGNILKSEILYADNQDRILKQLDQLSQKIREDLGESDIAIAQQNKPLSEVTTSSLAALKQYSLAIEYHWASNFEQARTYYQNALEIDSTFTSAKASLGNLLYERFDRDQGRQLLSEAVHSAEHLTEKEKLGILAFYAVDVENDLEKGIQYSKLRIDLYPDDPTPHNNLGWYYQKSGMYEDALHEYKKALEINPYLMLTYGGIIWIYLDILSEIDSAFVWTERMLKYDNQNSWGYFYLGSSFVGKDSLIQAEKAYLKAVSINPGFSMCKFRLGHVYRMLGQYDQAIEALHQIIEADPHQISAYYDMGINYQLAGQFEKAQNTFMTYQNDLEDWLNKDPGNANAYISLGLVFTRLGNANKGQEMYRQAVQLDSTLHIRFAEFWSVQNELDFALDHLARAIKGGYRNFVWIKLNPDLLNLQNNPRYQELIRHHFNR